MFMRKFDHTSTPSPRSGLSPMLAKPGPPPRGPGWAFEWKWDGMRLVAVIQAGEVKLLSRNGHNMTGLFPELPGELYDLLHGALGSEDDRVVLDGEVVCLDDQGKPDIGLIQRRTFERNDSPVTFMVFDVLEFAGHSLIRASYEQRRALLESLELVGSTVRVPANFTGIDGRELLAEARATGREGVVAKRLGSRYVPGLRSPSWIKSVCRARREVVIGGWKVGEERPVGSLMMGEYTRGGELRFVGHVGSGLSEATLDVLTDRLRGLEVGVCPFVGEVPSIGAHWVRPVLVGDVEYRAVTRKGLLLYPAWVYLRADKSPREVGVV